MGAVDDRDVELVGSHGRHDVIVRFVHPVQAGGLMNLDSIHFRPRNRGRFRLGIETASKEVRDRPIQANCRVFHRQEAQ